MMKKLGVGPVGGATREVPQGPGAWAKARSTPVPRLSQRTCGACRRQGRQQARPPLRRSWRPNPQTGREIILARELASSPPLATTSAPAFLLSASAVLVGRSVVRAINRDVIIAQIGRLPAPVANNRGHSQYLRQLGGSKTPLDRTVCDTSAVCSGSGGSCRRPKRWTVLLLHCLTPRADRQNPTGPSSSCFDR